MNKIKSLNEETDFRKLKKDKEIKTHRASRRDESEADDEDFEELKKIL